MKAKKKATDKNIDRLGNELQSIIQDIIESEYGQEHIQAFRDKITEIEETYILGNKIKKLLAEVYNNLGFFNVELEEHEKAILDFNKAMEINPNYEKFYLNRGVLYAKLGENEKAIKDFNKAIKLKSNYALAYNNRGNIYKKLGEHEKALEDYSKAIDLEPGYAEAYNNRGAAYNELGEYEKALEACDKAIELKPNYAEAYYNRGDAYSELGEPEKTIEDYNKAIELNPNFAEAYNNRGSFYYECGKYEKAIEDYSKAIGLKPDFAEAHYNQGSAYQKLGEHGKAIEDYSKILELNSDFAEAHNNQGVTYDKLSEYKKTLEDRSKAIKIKPNYAVTYSNRGNVNKELSQYEKAIKNSHKILELEELNLQNKNLDDDEKENISIVLLARYGLFQCLESQGKKEQARKELQRILEIHFKILGRDRSEIPKSKNSLDKILRQSLGSDELSERMALNVFTIIHSFRNHFIFIAAFFASILEQKLQLENLSNTSSSQRLKRLESIVKKICRFSNMELHQMQDIAGHRIILPSMEKLQGLQQALQQDLDYFTYKRSKDHILEPKEDGYRSLHLIYTLEKELTPASIFAPFQIELQLRTRYQHYWATAVEVVDTFHNSRIKQGEQNQSWTEFFHEASHYIASLENKTSGPNKQGQQSIVENYKSQIQELEDLQEQAEIVHKYEEPNQQQRYYLISVRGKQVEVDTFKEQDRQQAETRYEALEQDYINTQNSVFLTSTESLAQLKELYPNYFADTKEFIKLLKGGTAKP